jgi:hypothetical protein
VVDDILYGPWLFYHAFNLITQIASITWWIEAKTALKAGEIHEV